jgi:hypothetical protein
VEIVEFGKVLRIFRENADDQGRKGVNEDNLNKSEQICDYARVVHINTEYHESTISESPI